MNQSDGDEIIFDTDLGTIFGDMRAGTVFEIGKMVVTSVHTKLRQRQHSLNSEFALRIYDSITGGLIELDVNYPESSFSGLWIFLQSPTVVEQIANDIRTKGFIKADALHQLAGNFEQYVNNDPLTRRQLRQGNVAPQDVINRFRETYQIYLNQSLTNQDMAVLESIYQMFSEQNDLLDVKLNSVTKAIQKSTKEFIKKSRVENLRSGDLVARVISNSDFIPHKVDKLFGRDEVVHRLINLLDNGDDVLLQGFPGNGKSAIAAKVAQHWVDGKKAVWLEVGEKDINTLKNALLLALEKPNDQHITVDIDAHIQHLLNDNNVTLFVLDNIVKSSILRNFLNVVPSSVRVLATSQSTLSSNTKKIKLKGLDRRDSIAFIEHYISLEIDDYVVEDLMNDDKINDLCELAADNPYALRIAGAMLATNNLFPGELLERIDNEPAQLEIPEIIQKDGKEGVATLLNESIERLSESSKELLYIFAMFNSLRLTPIMALMSQISIGERRDDLLDILIGKKFSQDLVGDEHFRIILVGSVLERIVSDNISDVETSLDLLVQSGLVERLRSPFNAQRYYEISKLLYNVLRLKSNSDFLRVAPNAAYNFFAYHQAVNPENHDAFALEIDNLLSAIQVSFTAQNYEHVVKFGFQLDRKLSNGGFDQQVDELMKFVERSSQKLGESLSEAWAILYQGHVHRRKRKFMLARAAYDKASLVAEQIEHNLEKANTIIAYAKMGLGNILIDEAEMEQASSEYNEAIDYANKVDDPLVLAEVLGNYATVFLLQDDSEQALDYYVQYLSAAESGNYTRHIVEANLKLSGLYQARDLYEQAMEHTLRAVTIASDNSLFKLRGRALATASRVGVLLNQYDKASEYANMAQNLRLDNDSRYILEVTFGDIAMHESDYLTAKNHYATALELTTITHYMKAEGLNRLGLVFKKEHEYEKAIEQFEQSINILKRINQSKQLGETLSNYQDVLYLMAYDNVQQVHDIVQKEMGELGLKWTDDLYVEMLPSHVEIFRLLDEAYPVALQGGTVSSKTGRDQEHFKLLADMIVSMRKGIPMDNLQHNFEILSSNESDFRT